MIGDRIRAERETRGWDRAVLAEKSGISIGYIRQLENNFRPNPGKSTLEKLARAFGISVDGLLNGTSAPTPVLEPPVNLWRILGWPEDLITETVEDWDDYSSVERLEMIQSAQELDRRNQEQQEAIRAKRQRRAPLVEAVTPKVAPSS